jgi:outer membrane protein assembly factor BamB
MIGRRFLAHGAVVMALVVGLGGCSVLRTIGGSGKNRDLYQGTGTRIPVLPGSQQLEPAAALQGVDFAIPAEQPRTEWTVAGGTTENSVEHVTAAPNFEVAWRRGVGVGTSRRAHVTATPIVAAGRIYTMDGRAGISARSEQTGAEIWRTDLAPRSGRDREAYGGGLAFADGVLFVSSGFRFVTALDAATGQVKWRTAMTSPVHGAPTVSDGRVFVVDVEDQMFVLDAASGDISWNYQALEEPARILAASAPAVSGDVVIAPFASGEVVALRAPNGTMLWNDTLSFTNRNNALSEIRDVTGKPVIYRGDVFAGSHSGLVAAISLRDGQRRWELPITTITTPLPAGDVVYITDQSGRVFCVSRENGLVYWSVNLNADVKKAKNRAIWSGPLLASDRLVVVSDHGEAVALNPKTGARIKSIRLGGPAFITPIAVNGTIYVLTEEAQLVAIR